ncbi:MAG TPA: competence/damage-inducible protein A [Vicinamibacterales bacterium]|nr:competence/damage-inducible protein A [Vicinamibacterales bacterium]
MNAYIIAVGSELLTPLRMDTNSLAITERLNAIGIDVRAKAVVGDDLADLGAVVRHALAHADLVVMTGGLGPTADDLTRDAVAEVLGLPLVEDETIVERIRARFAARGWQMPEINRRQARVPRGAVLLPNANGTAPGLWIEHDRRTLVLLPGPPRELLPILDTLIAERLAPRAGGRRVYRRVLKITGRAESHVDQMAQPIYARWLEWDPPIATTILAALGQIELHLRMQSADPARAAATLDGAVAELRDALGDAVFSVDGRSIEQVVGDLLRAAGLWIATAESCTGGLMASRLTDVPGSSEYVERGVVCYSNRAKVELLGVPEALIAGQGAVSEPVAQAMARGIRDRARVDIGVGITGVAGPGGGTEAKPVGTVAVAAVVREREMVKTFRFIGAREQVKYQAAQAGLDMVRRMLAFPQA